MKHTTNYNLKKPEGNDYVNINDLNENMDVIDEKLKENEESINNIDAPSTEEFETLEQEFVSHKAEKATPTKLGHIKVGQGLEIDSEGVLSVNAEGVPSGVITMWSGANIPNGWALCDGDNGTPDLRDRFIVGAGGDYSVGDTGGEAEVTLTTAQLPSHSHGSGSLSTGSSGSHSHGSGSLSTNSTGAHTHSYTYVGYAERSTYQSGGSQTARYGSTITRNSTSGSSGSHSHSISGSTSSAGSHSHSVSGTTSSAGSGQAHENRPPYFALAFIMKL